MKSHTEYLTFTIPTRMDFLNITPQVEECVDQSGIREGLCLVNAMHITASVFINDDEPGLHEDYKKWLEQLAPFDPSPERYHHNRTGEDNADAHHKRQIMGREVVVAITKGKLDFGRGNRSSTASSMADGRSACWRMHRRQSPARISIRKPNWFGGRFARLSTRNCSTCRSDCVRPFCCVTCPV